LNEVTNWLQRRFFTMEGPLKEALSLARKGRLSGVKRSSLLEPFRDEWGFALDLIEKGGALLKDDSLMEEWT
jgi:hypothetical protein